MPDSKSQRARFKKIFLFALPIMGGMASQNLLNLVDTAMVGSCGKAALAAVGIAGFANFMSQAFLTGLSSGVQAIAARRVGEARHDVTAVPLNGGLLISLLLGVPLSVLMVWLAPTLYPYLVDDPKVVAVGVPYLEVRLLGIVAVASNFCFRGYWNGVSKSRIYFSTLVVMHVCNVIISYSLIYGVPALDIPAYGALGAGIGTTISVYIGTLIYLAQGFLNARKAGLFRGLPDRADMVGMLRLAVPTGMQQFFFAAGFTTLFWIVGQVGTDELAAANVLLNIMLVAVLPGIGLGLAAASLAGQALGSGDISGARAWGVDVVKVGIVILMVLGLPMVLATDFVLGIFLHDPAVIDLARLPLRIVGSLAWLDGVGLILMNALMGAGDVKRVGLSAVGLQWLVFLPAAYLVGPVLGHGLLGIWICQIVYRVALALIFGLMWRGDRWTQIEV